MSYVFHWRHAFLFSQEPRKVLRYCEVYFVGVVFDNAETFLPFALLATLTRGSPDQFRSELFLFPIWRPSHPQADFRPTWRPNTFCCLITCSPFIHWSVLNILGVDQANLDFKFKMAKAARYFWRSFLEPVLTKETFTHKWNFLINFLLVHFSKI